MIDPTKFTDYNLQHFRMQEYILFCIAVAGKNAITTATRLERFLRYAHDVEPLTSGWQPFVAVQKFQLEKLKTVLKSFGFGCFNLKAKGFHYIANSGLDLYTCSWEDLERCPGIGQKTSRFFILHTRKDANVACLDTHILKWLSDLGYSHVPKQSPQSKKIYKKYEDIFLQLATKKKMSPADLDLMIWNQYRVKK